MSSDSEQDLVSARIMELLTKRVGAICYMEHQYSIDTCNDDTVNNDIVSQQRSSLYHVNRPEGQFEGDLQGPG